MGCVRKARWCMPTFPSARRQIRPKCRQLIVSPYSLSCIITERVEGNEHNVTMVHDFGHVESEFAFPLTFDGTGIHWAPSVSLNTRRSQDRFIRSLTSMVNIRKQVAKRVDFANDGVTFCWNENIYSRVQRIGKTRCPSFSQLSDF